MNASAEPTCGEYSVVYDHYAAIPMKDGCIITDAPSLAKTSDGALLCAVPMIVREGTPKGEFNPLHFFRSEDRGETWAKLPATSGFCCGKIFKQGETLFFIGAGPVHRHPESGMKIIRSDDDGLTWTEPSVLFKGPFYNPATGHVIRGGRFYWCFDRGRDTPEAYTYVVAGDLNRDLTDPAAWRVSEPLKFPGVPDSLVIDPPKRYRWLEGNVVEVEGKLRACWRLYSVGNPDIRNLAVICDIEDDGQKIDYRFLRYQPWPGAQNHFHVVFDDVSGLYWMTSNLAGASPALLAKVGMGGRRILALHCSFDTVNWLPAGYVIVWPLLRQSSNYCGLTIDGDDLLVAARTSRNGRSHHDNDLTTFHRIKDFRKRAAVLVPGEE